jgi:tRNA1(Val) A37 N6-methylase TrmN6
VWQVVLVMEEALKDFDELWPGGPRFRLNSDSFRLSTDSVLLADFAEIRKGERVLDLGSGAGVLTVLIAAANGTARVTGLEIRDGEAELSRENVSANGLGGRVEILTCDLREHRSLKASGSFDAVVTNPPFFPQSSGYSAPEPGRAISREERDCSLADICLAAKWALRWGGAFYMVHRPERLSEAFCAMTAAGIEPKRLRLVQYAGGKAPSLALIAGRRGGAPGLKISAPLILTDSDGNDSTEAQRIYRRGAFAPEREEGL